MKLGKIAATTALAMTLASCGPSDEDFAKQALAKVARNPQSIQVRNVHLGMKAALTRDSVDKIICGEWNGQNGLGGMGEWSKFAVFHPDGDVTTNEPGDNPEITNMSLNLMCPS